MFKSKELPTSEPTDSEGANRIDIFSRKRIKEIFLYELKVWQRWYAEASDLTCVEWANGPQYYIDESTKIFSSDQGQFDNPVCIRKTWPWSDDIEVIAVNGTFEPTREEWGNVWAYENERNYISLHSTETGNRQEYREDIFRKMPMQDLEYRYMIDAEAQDKLEMYQEEEEGDGHHEWSISPEIYKIAEKIYTIRDMMRSNTIDDHVLWLGLDDLIDERKKQKNNRLKDLKDQNTIKTIMERLWDKWCGRNERDEYERAYQNVRVSTEDEKKAMTILWRMKEHYGS